MSAANKSSLADTSGLPIGVFDSGLGGLTVLKALRERFPHESFIYLGDTARIPYGIKSARTITKYLEQNLRYLCAQKVKAVVVACNSASSVADQVSSPVPLYNVIEPGSRRAALVSREARIGVIATKATVAGKAYVTKLQELNPNIKVFQQACPLLVPLVEEGWDDDPITNLIVYRYISPLLAVKIDTLIMGCTHYPILRSTIQKVVGGDVELVDSGVCVCEQLEKDFASLRLPPNHSGEKSDVRFLSTDISENFQALAQRIMAPLPIRQFELIDLM
jgi:glutamate racemase